MYKDLSEAIIVEAIFIILTVIVGIMEAWGLFAVLALLCLLVPLWIIAAVAVIHLDLTAKAQAEPPEA